MSLNRSSISQRHSEPRGIAEAVSSGRSQLGMSRLSRPVIVGALASMDGTVVEIPSSPLARPSIHAQETFIDNSQHIRDGGRKRNMQNSVATQYSMLQTSRRVDRDVLNPMNISELSHGADDVVNGGSRMDFSKSMYNRGQNHGTVEADVTNEMIIFDGNAPFQGRVNGSGEAGHSSPIKQTLNSNLHPTSRALEQSHFHTQPQLNDEQQGGALFEFFNTARVPESQTVFRPFGSRILNLDIIETEFSDSSGNDSFDIPAPQKVVVVKKKRIKRKKVPLAWDVPRRQIPTKKKPRKPLNKSKKSRLQKNTVNRLLYNSAIRLGNRNESLLDCRIGCPVCKDDEQQVL